MTNDPVNPTHYRNSSNKQIIDMIRWFPFNLGNTMKYIYRYNGKGKPIEDLKKALWYFQDYLTNPSHIAENNENMVMSLFEELYDMNDFRKEATMLLLETYYNHNASSSEKFVSIVENELSLLQK